MAISILDRAAKLFASFRCERLAAFGSRPNDFSRMDSGVLQVAMMVSALDGEVLDEELRMFDDLARECAGYNVESVAGLLERGLRSAGYLALQAHRLGADELIAAFTAEAGRVLPEDFADWRIEDIRHAFALWVTMAMSDRDYSQIERRAVRSLFDRISSAIHEASEANGNRAGMLSPAHVSAYANRNASETSRTLDEGLLDRIESAVKDGGFEKLEDIIRKG